MQYCTKCGQQLQDGTIYCSKCGTTQADDGMINGQQVGGGVLTQT